MFKHCIFVLTQIHIYNLKMASFKLNAKKFIVIALLLFAIGLTAIWYIFTVKFKDTSKEKSDFTITAIDLIKDFKKNDSLANIKYGEKVISVSGIITSVEKSDSSVNVKMNEKDSTSYIIFAFQEQHLADAKSIKEGDNVIIKGSCSGGAYSSILETEFITFKRCAISK